ncbi:ribosomal RNA small subunit methyltransferase E-like isoform X3 [Zingiber officinale]|uniref:ribosomal RNA small subunit methyltransferase E-like isoform X3 n=1 Tax=Zingiber officinale TaxID=94328 RepID=UPI001C4ABE96|nr:ribosomal RNA small subunit methyltransferase E-like isoform X3 [Zingiber officinale]
MPRVSPRLPLCGGLLCRTWRRGFSGGLRVVPSDAAGSQSRGGLPRFHSPLLLPSKGNVVRIQGDEFWHMSKVLRLGPNDRVQLFDGKGGLVEGCIQSVSRAGLDIMAVEEPQVVPPQGIQWHVYAAFGTLKGGRADWLVEKCTELGASSVTPILTERSHTIAENRVERLERVVVAAAKQCQRLHQMTLNPPLKLQKLLSLVSESKLAFLASAEETPLMNVLYHSTAQESGILIVGPEGVLRSPTVSNSLEINSLQRIVWNGREQRVERLGT